MAHVKKSLSKASLDAMVRTAQDEPGIPVKPEAFDADPWLLNCTNGTIDLHTGGLRPHVQGDLLTKCLPMAYDEGATCPLWERFLWRIMGGSQGEDSPDMGAGELENRHLGDELARALIDFLQRAIGYTLTGSTREQCLFILHGKTKTGKSTFLATLRALLGPYGQQADMESFLHKDRQEVRNDLADLAGSRCVCALESQEGRRLAESLVKQLTGGTDFIKARFLFQEHFTFKPQFKIFLGTNHKPVIRDTDSAIWERIRLVPFTVHIPQPERDKTLDERLQTELPGILAWAVRGSLEWQRLGELGEPDAVVQATAGYRSEMDTMARFLDECCVTENLPEDAKVKASALASAYQTWCKRTGELPLANRAFITDLEERGYRRKRGNANQYYWHGLGLVNTEDERYE
jgi:putative DNA primase/helicase